MDSENNRWDLADQDFNEWLNGNKEGSDLALSDILKSMYLAFRQKEIQRLGHFCNEAFENYQEQESIKLQKVHESDFEYEPIMFRIERLSESELKAKTQKENQRIIEGILTGDYKVFKELYEYEFPKVVNLIIKNSGNVEMAQDVFQDAIVILMEKVYAQKIDLTCSVKTYLYSICKYLWLEQLRQNKREKQLIQFFDEEYNIDDVSVLFYNTPEILENVATAINALGNPCKQLLECFYYKNMSWEEIASSLDYANAGSARNQKYKCLERIRNIVNVDVE